MAEKETKAVNEFNQHVKPASLWADAWKRLRKNRMALISLWIVGFYFVISLSAPLLTGLGLLADNATQYRGHESLPPSFSSAGTLVKLKLEKLIKGYEESLAAKGESADGTGWSAEQGFNFGGDTTEEETTSEEITTEDSGFALQSAFVDPVQQSLDTALVELADAEARMNEPYFKKVYLLGTDDLGRDLLARVIYGGRISIMIGIIGTITAVILGVIIGAFSGYLGGRIDNLIMRFVDIMYGLPYMLVVIIIMSIAGQGGSSNIFVLFIAIALVSWLTIARVVRGQIISLKNSEFVEAARSMGAHTPRIIFRHLLPNALGIIVVYATLSMPSFIMSESFLSFLGLGISAPDASWGTLVNEGRNVIELRPHQLVVPALSMTIFLFSMNFLGDGLRDALDPQSKNRT